MIYLLRTVARDFVPTVSGLAATCLVGYARLHCTIWPVTL